MRRSCRPTRAAVWLRCRPPRAGQHHGGTCAVGQGLRRPVRHVKPRAHASASADGERPMQVLVRTESAERSHATAAATCTHC
eukprot:3035600-Pleurochrysis_carterae.AAC.4